MWKCRRDSYVTHRAYCVALAEETARLNAASTNIANNNNSLADNYINNNNPPQLFFPNYSSNLFKPNETSPFFFNNNNTPTIPLPFWIPTNPHQINNFHYPTTTTTTATATTNSDVLSVPSLFSNEEQQSSHQFMSSSPNMSATLLLQKAAQIGVTTDHPSSLMESLGLKFSSITDGKALLSGIYGSMINSNSNNVIIPLSEENHHHHHYSAPPAKRMRHTVSEESVNGGEGETRDFLGVGMHTICHPSTVNGWIWF